LYADELQDSIRYSTLVRGALFVLYNVSVLSSGVFLQAKPLWWWNISKLHFYLFVTQGNKWYRRLRVVKHDPVYSARLQLSTSGHKVNVTVPPVSRSRFDMSSYSANIFNVDFLSFWKITPINSFLHMSCR